jgi:hypothetical protein
MSQFSLFVTLLMTAITSGGSSAAWDLSKIEALWSQAGAQLVAAAASPSPSSSPTSSPYTLATPEGNNEPIAIPSSTPSPTLAFPSPPPVADSTPVVYPTPWALPSFSPDSLPSMVAAAPVSGSYPTPYVLPSAAAASIASGNYVQTITLSQFFTGNTPFHHTVASLLAGGATVRPQSVVDKWWNSGPRQPERPNGATPIYMGFNGQRTITMASCNLWGACNATGASFHLPAGAQIQSTAGGNQDQHIAVVDTVSGEYIGGFGCQISGGTMNCANGAKDPLSGSGMSIDTGSPTSTDNAGGYALALFIGTYADIKNSIQSGQPIPHAFGVTVPCVDDTPAWPSVHHADNSTNALCPGSVSYGDGLALNASYVVPSGASAPCRALLISYQAMGLYVDDVDGGYGTVEQVENPIVYTSGPNPWYTDVEPQMAAHGEGSNPGPGFGFSCISKWTTASDWFAFQLAHGEGDTGAPPATAMVAQPQ